MSKPIRTQDLVTKSNALVEANYKLSLLEQKFVAAVISTIHRDDEDFKTYTFRIKDFWDLMGLEGSPKYSEVRKMTKNLMRKTLEIQNGDKLIQVNWFASCIYHNTEGLVEITFAPVLKPYLLQLKSSFTSYHLKNILKMNSVYSIRLYELLKQHAWREERTLTVSELRKMIGAEEVYKLYGSFKQRALVPAQKEIGEKTDIDFEIEEIKKGRAVDKLRFTIKTKKPVSKKSSSFPLPFKGKPIRTEMVPEWLGKEDDESEELSEEEKAANRERYESVKRKLRKYQ